MDLLPRAASTAGMDVGRVNINIAVGHGFASKGDVAGMDLGKGEQ